MSWEPDTPIGFSPCGTAFGAIRRAYVAKANFFADEGPAATNRIKWYVVPDDTPVYDDWTSFWPRVDVPPDQAHTQFEYEGHGRDVRRFYAGNDIYGYDKDHVHGDPDDFLGKSLREKYFVDGEPDPVQPCVGTGVFAKFRFRNTFGLVAARARFKFSAHVVHVFVERNCYYLCLNGAENQYAMGPNIPGIDGSAALSVMFFGRRAAANSPVIVSQAREHTRGRVEVLLWSDGLIYFIASTATTLNYATYAGCNDNLLHHIAMVFDGAGATDADRLKGYVDGVAVALSFATSIPTTIGSFGASMRVGWQWTNPAFQTGDIDDVAVFPFAASAALVHGIAARTSNPSVHSPLLLLRFEEGEGTIAHDSSGNHNDFTLYNGAGFCGDVCLPRSAARFRWRGRVRLLPDILPRSAARFKFRGAVVNVVTPGTPIAGRFRFRGVVINVVTPGTAIKGRFRFRGVVIHVGPVVTTSVGRFRFRGVVGSGVDDGGIAVSRFRFHADVINVVTPGRPIEAKFRFKAALWERSIPGSTLSIAFDASIGQWQTYASLGSFTTGTLTIFFWGRVPDGVTGPIVSVVGDGDQVFEVIITHGVGLGIEIHLEGLVDGDPFEWTGNAAVPSSSGWHHYCLTPNPSPPEGEIKYDFYVDGLPVEVLGDPIPADFAFAHLDGLTVIGQSKDERITTGKMDDVGILIGSMGAEQIFGIANATEDAAFSGLNMLFRYEEDIDPLAWETIRADWFEEFIGEPAHSDDVPELLDF